MLENQTVYLYNDGGEFLGFTLTDAGGNYAFTNLIDDSYIVSLPTTFPPLDLTILTTTVSDTPATNVVESALSVYQYVPISGACEFDVDFAFVFTNDFDFGDLPSSYNTLLSDSPDGPRHIVTFTNLFLGAELDTEADGVPSAEADGDGADEDGVLQIEPENWHEGSTGGFITVTISGTGWLTGWIDFNDDGVFSGTNEFILNEAVTSGTQTNVFDIPVGTFTNMGTNIYARFRLSPSKPPIPALSYVGLQLNGEVEDYYWTNVGVNAATYALIGSFDAYAERGRVMVQWETMGEVGTLGFYLERLTDAGYTRVRPKLIPSVPGAPQGGYYRVLDPDEGYKAKRTYRLIELEANGRQKTYGPFEVTVKKRRTSADKRASSTKVQKAVERRARTISTERRARNEVRGQERSEELDYRRQLIGSLIKIPVDEDGLYYLSTSDLGALLEIPEAILSRYIRARALQLSVQGQSVRYTAADGGVGLYFYGKKHESIFTDDNIYWIGFGKARRMKPENGGGPSPVEGELSFEHQVKVEEDVWASTAIFWDPEGDFWLWDVLFGGFPGFDTATHPIVLPGVATSALSAAISVELMGASALGDEPQHGAVVSINGTQVGSGDWAGINPFTLDASFAQNLLLDGSNSVEVVGQLNPGVPFGQIGLDEFAIKYQRRYEAEGDRLLFTGGTNPVVTVSGFSSEEINVFNVTDPNNPRYLIKTTIDGAPGNWRVSLEVVDSNAVYLAFTVDSAETDVSPLATVATDLTSAENRGEYIVIAPGEFMLTAERLINRRTSQGLECKLVELEEAYDAFNFGLASPKAIQNFLSHAYTYWDLPPRYVVLLGCGTYDYKDFQHVGDNLIPAMLVSTPWGLFGSDSQLADVVGGDGVPEIALGRIPAVTDAELNAYIDKLEAYEDSDGLGWSNKVLVVADDRDGGGHFQKNSDELIAKMPHDYVAEKHYIPTATTSNLIESINEGAGFLNYAGHGALDRIADETIFSKADVPLLNNAEKAPVVVAMSCIIGRYEIPGFDSLAEDLLLHPNGGAIAVFSPTSLSLNRLAKLLNTAYVESLYQGGHRVLGDVILGAYEGYGNTDGDAFMLHVYNLLGDPATLVK